mmetsp:Transcript_10808/g.16093  ORF Transcript_10808/g.16093 Transcript_10808/m.16093 type:complete len:260 (+) Transcript_10808:9-788(+)
MGPWSFLPLLMFRIHSVASINSFSDLHSPIQTPSVLHKPGKCRLFRCSVCHVTFSSNISLHYHIASSPDRVISCSHCRRRFHDTQSRDNHEELVHTKQNRTSMTCNSCGMVFQSRTLYLRHTKKRSFKTWTCTDCGKEFKHSSNWHRHKKVHSVHRPYVCNVCNASFKLIHLASQHMRRHNPGAYNRHSCDICNASFAYITGMFAHRRMHQSFRPYECSQCSSTFRLRHHLLTHLRRMHSVSKISQLVIEDSKLKLGYK